MSKVFENDYGMLSSNPYVEEMFDMWLNVYYQLTHPKNQEITKNIKVEYIY